MDVLVERDPAAIAGLSGVLIRPAGATSTRGVLLLGGSEGGLHERDATALAAEGFTVLALAYFGAPGVPPALKEIPVEYFSRGVDVLLMAGAQQIGVLGSSRGGEAALLLASRDERIAAVVSVVGSGVLTQGIDYSLGSVDRILRTPTVAWTADGAPLPALSNRVTADFEQLVAEHGTVSLRSQYSPLPTDTEALERISIPVERIHGAVLLISAGADGMWDSATYSAVAAARLHDHPHPWEHVVLAGAGHAIAGPPGRPFATSTTPGPGVTFEMGGDPAVTTAAREQAWAHTMAFFIEHLS